MKFRPCIDIHQGIVKQIVGGTLTDSESPQTNFKADKPAEWFAECYRKDNLTGGHIIQLGAGNETAARAALTAWPGGMQLGGGVSADNATDWLDAGAEAVIVTSWVFHDGIVDKQRLTQLRERVGKNRLVLDLSCRRRGNDYHVVTNRWQNFTREVVTPQLLDELAEYAFEFLIHAVDVEGKCNGIETHLVGMLGKWAEIPITYAGGIRSIEDIELIRELGNGAIDFTVGSALDIFGGSKLVYRELADRYSIK